MAGRDTGGPLTAAGTRSAAANHRHQVRRLRVDVLAKTDLRRETAGTDEDGEPVGGTRVRRTASRSVDALTSIGGFLP